MKLNLALLLGKLVLTIIQLLLGLGSYVRDTGWKMGAGVPYSAHGWLPAMLSTAFKSFPSICELIFHFSKRKAEVTCYRQPLIF